MSVHAPRITSNVAPSSRVQPMSPNEQREPVAVSLSRFPTLTETFILREIDELERQGQPVRLVPIIKWSPPVMHEAAKPWTARALYTPFLSLSIVGANLRALAKRPLRYAATLARLIIGTVRKPSTCAYTLALFPKSIYLAEQLSREGVRHIHVHFATHPATMALIISRFSCITFSITVHAYDIQLDRSLLRWKLREARFVRSISEFNKQYLEKLYPAEAVEKIHVIHIGIVPHMYDDEVNRLPEVADAVPRILCVAAHKPYKGLPVLIEACRILRDQGIVFECDLVGTGPMREELEQMIRDRGLAGRVHLLGPLPEKDVARKMASSTLFALASVIEMGGKMEGIPVALMEAMASGRPVVSTWTSGIPELVEDGVSGLLVPPGDAVALSEALRALLTDPRRAHQLGERAREKVRQEFSLDTCVARLLALIDRETRRVAG